jgi:hypothetical protein
LNSLPCRPNLKCPCCTTDHGTRKVFWNCASSEKNEYYYYYNNKKSLFQKKKKKKIGTYRCTVLYVDVVSRQKI